MAGLLTPAVRAVGGEGKLKELNKNETTVGLPDSTVALVNYCSRG